MIAVQEARGSNPIGCATISSILDTLVKYLDKESSLYIPDKNRKL